MNSSIDMIFEQKCHDAVKREVLSLSSDKEGRIFMFGSRAKGDYKRGSDIDIGFEGMDDEDFRKKSI